MTDSNEFLQAAQTIQQNEAFFSQETELQTQDPNYIPNIQGYVGKVEESAKALKFLNEHCQKALNEINKIIETTAPQQPNQ